MRSHALRLLALMGISSAALWSSPGNAQPVPVEPPAAPPPALEPSTEGGSPVEAAPQPGPTASPPSITPALGPGSPQLRGESIPADQARQTTGGGGVEGEDAALWLPRAVFFLPARVIQLVSLPIRGGLTFVQKHYVLEEIEDFF